MTSYSERRPHGATDAEEEAMHALLLEELVRLHNGELLAETIYRPGRPARRRRPPRDRR